MHICTAIACVSSYVSTLSCTSHSETDSPVFEVVVDVCSRACYDAE